MRWGGVLAELRPGLWRWAARHPEWRPGAARDSPGDWPPKVGCVACAAAGALVLVDPLVPAGEEEPFWARVDDLVARHGPRVVVLTTIGFHRRSREAVVERYGASTSRARAALPAGVRTVPIRRAGEAMVWLAEHRALVPGDRLIGGPAGGVRMCPPSWLGYLPGGMTIDALREALAPVLDLPVEMVLVSHGEPVLHDGRAAIEAAVRES